MKLWYDNIQYEYSESNPDYQNQPFIVDTTRLIGDELLITYLSSH